MVSRQKDPATIPKGIWKCDVDEETWNSLAVNFELDHLVTRWPMNHRFTESTVCTLSLVNFFLYQLENRQESQPSVSVFHMSSVCTYCWQQFLAVAALWPIVSMYCSRLRVPVCLRDMCTDLLLVEHAKGKVTTMSPSFPDHPGHQAGPQESDSRSSWAGFAEGGWHAICCTSFKTYQLALGLFLPLTPSTCICQICLSILVCGNFGQLLLREYLLSFHKSLHF